VFTNVDIDPDLIGRVMAVTGLSTKRAAVDAGLRALLLLHQQGEVRDLRGRLHWEGVDLPPADPGPEPARKGRTGVRPR
jgi:Arc/MetJ family transcription regulator